MRKLKKILKLLKKLNNDCCNPDDEYINVSASTNSVIPTCDYMSKITGGLPSLDSSYVHSKNCLCECPGSLVSPDLIDEKTITIKSGCSSKGSKKKRCTDGLESSEKASKSTFTSKLRTNKFLKPSWPLFSNTSTKLYIAVAFICCTCLMITLLILKYLSIYIFKNDTVTYF
ncbi:protein EE8 [Proboscivirus elephantidbeta5]|uniref:Protein EE8 n=1 Tax=Elephant endotheliotropic herpesvirus 5 TaxID=768738 RepID=A0A075CZL3_9BETA|nr:protein EE8 [Elephant endotheliotropic herpesvirus 5]AHC02848.1 protein EE8 [Elephant endotheliotropic herpesvirus 5]